MRSDLLKTIFLKKYVDFRSIDLNTSENSAAIDRYKMTQINGSVLFCDNDFFIALNPATHKFSLPRMKKVIGKDLSELGKVEEQQLSLNLLNGKEHDSINRVHVYIDEALEYQDELYVVDEGKKHAYIIDIKQLQKLSSDELIGISFSEEVKTSMGLKEKVSFKERVQALHSLPLMPDTASKILVLRATHDVKVEQIVEVVEQSPSLAAHIVSYANSAFFGQAGTVKSLKDAIFRVLGVDAVMNMALALSIGSTFNIPTAGPIGSKSIWKSSIYTASLMQRLSMLMPWGDRPNPGTAYLIGLLHDIGLLVIGHLFTDEYIELNDYIEKNSDENIFTAEQNVLGISHIEVGKLVMKMWNMPQELITVATYISDENYQDEYEKYIQLLSVVKTLLAPHGLSFGNNLEGISSNLLEKLDLEEEDVILAADEVIQEGEIIKKLVTQMCA